MNSEDDQLGVSPEQRPACRASEVHSRHGEAVNAMGATDRNIHDLAIYPLATPLGWELVRNRLFNIEPDDANNIAPADGLSVWQACFNEDLVFCRTTCRSRAILVTWHPDVSEHGEYVVKVVARKDAIQHDIGITRYDWQNPREVYRTRSLSQLLQHFSLFANKYSMTS